MSFILCHTRSAQQLSDSTDLSDQQWSPISNSWQVKLIFNQSSPPMIRTNKQNQKKLNRNQGLVS